jgi:integrase
LSPSKYRHKTYPNLYRFPDSKNWVFKKYSSEKKRIKWVDGKPVETYGAEFRFSTGESSNAALAYKLGIDEFNKWLAKPVIEIAAEENAEVFFGPYATEIRDKKLAQPDAVFRKNSKRATKRDYTYLIGKLGHYPIARVTPDVWRKLYSDELQKKPQKFYNRRKALVEIMLQAKGDGLLDPNSDWVAALGVARKNPFINPDQEEDHGEYLERDAIRKLLRAATWEHAKSRQRYRSRLIKLLIFWMWKMGARPGEILQYRWDMIKWKEGPHGRIHIPGTITKTKRSRVINLNSMLARYLRMLRRQTDSAWIFPSRKGDGPLTVYNKVWERVTARAGLDANMYWLRGSFITDALERGFSSVFIGKFTDTSPQMIEKRYAKAKKAMMERLAD